MEDKSNETIARRVDGNNDIRYRREFLDKVFEQKVPSEDRFTWSDPSKEGNSDCRLKDDAEVTYYDKSKGENVKVSGKEFNTRMKNLYGRDTVSYTAKEPDFEPFEQEFSEERLNSYLNDRYGEGNTKKAEAGLPGHVEVSKISDDRTETQREATGIVTENTGLSADEIKGYMKANGITWHECGDGKTLRAVPTEVNSVYGHTGGIGLSKDLDAAAETFKNNTEGIEGTPGNEISIDKWTEMHKEEMIANKKEKNNSITNATKADKTQRTSKESGKSNIIAAATNKAEGVVKEVKSELGQAMEAAKTSTKER